MRTSAKNELLDGIVDNLLLFFPFFYRKLLKVAHAKTRTNPINMELRALFILNDAGQMQSSEMGRKLGISKPNVTPLVDKLISQGYVTRLPDFRDRRVVNISITDKGKRFVNNKRRLLANNIKDNLSSLKPKELEALYSSLVTFKDIISRIGDVY
jgi:MarR family multiple antibiotic resistance transcriptional regulator